MARPQNATMPAVPDLLRPDRSIGVFETLLVIDGAPIELDAHLRRLDRSVRELFGAALPPGMRDLLRRRAAGLPVGRLRLTAVPRDDGSLGMAVMAAPVDPQSLFPPWARAVTLRAVVIDGGLGAHKWADRDLLAAGEASEAEGVLPVVLDAGEELLEASRANVFAIEQDVLVTPPADGRILAGVARARTIDTARSLGIEVREERLDVERLLAAGEAFLTGSVRGIEPVRALGEARLRPPRELLAELAAELKRAWGIDRPSVTGVRPEGNYCHDVNAGAAESLAGDTRPC
jgi:para-aminobenzoate synthetase / 4-amino-4-deoxychorismate lyase